MRRLANFDISGNITAQPHKFIAQIAFGVACALSMILLRGVFDYFAPTSGPFALVYPTVLIATLFGHWQGGLAAYGLTFVWAWWFVLPTVRSFHFEIATDPSRVFINALANCIILVLAEAFRRAVRDAVKKRDLEIKRRSVLLQELEHRTKNNFALVASLLEMQKRRLTEEEAIEAISQAISRVHTFAKAYAVIVPYESPNSAGFPVSVPDYLQEIVNSLELAAFDENVTIEIDACPYTMPHNMAVAVGLFVNEALTNCAKYAFPDGRPGKVDIVFKSDEQDGWEVVVKDDGIGRDDVRVPGGSKLGQSLMRAFASQAGGEYEILETDKGFASALRGMHP